jgi:SAM-dependent methyltransferase
MTATIERTHTLKRLAKKVPLLSRVSRFIRYQVIGHQDTQWARVIMEKETTELLDSLQPENLNVLEISGRNWANALPFLSYKVADYPDYDICSEPLSEFFDLIIAEQVFEHLLYPYRAGKNVYAMLKPGGYFLITTPFLIKVHNHPTDCSRWTEVGIKYFLSECGFPLDRIKTGSWGNRACVRANFKDWCYYNRLFHSLENEPDYPVSVWALAQKPSIES